MSASQWAVPTPEQHAALLLAGFVGPNSTGDYEQARGRWRMTVVSVHRLFREEGDGDWQAQVWAAEEPVGSMEYESMQSNDPVECARWALANVERRG